MFQDSIKRIVPAVLVLLLASCSGLPTLNKPAADSADTQVSAAAHRDYQDVVAQLAAEDDSAAIRNLEKFIARYPEYPGAYTNLAIVYDRQQRAAEALEALAIAVAIDANFAPAHNQIGLIKRRDGDFAAAEQAWKAATIADPEYAYAWHNLGVLYDLYLADLPAALEHYQRYQLLADNSADQEIDRWVADLQRRIAEPTRTARLGEAQ